MGKITLDRYHGGRNVPVRYKGLAQDMQDVADDLAGIQVGAVTEPAAGGTYTAAEQALLNEIRDLLIAANGHELLTTKG
jgi:hypothetical protein